MTTEDHQAIAFGVAVALGFLGGALWQWRRCRSERATLRDAARVEAQAEVQAERAALNQALVEVREHAAGLVRAARRSGLLRPPT